MVSFGVVDGSKGLAQNGLKTVAPVGIEAEGDTALGKLGNVQHSAVVRFLEEDADLASVLIAGVVEEHDVERRAADAVAVASRIDHADAGGLDHNYCSRASFSSSMMRASSTAKAS